MELADELKDIAPVSRSERPSAMSATEALENARDVTPEKEEGPEIDPETGEEIPASFDEPTQGELDA